MDGKEVQFPGGDGFDTLSALQHHPKSWRRFRLAKMVEGFSINSLDFLAGTHKGLSLLTGAYQVQSVPMVGRLDDCLGRLDICWCF